MHIRYMSLAVGVFASACMVQPGPEGSQSQSFTRTVVHVGADGEIRSVAVTQVSAAQIAHDRAGGGESGVTTQGTVINDTSNGCSWNSGAGDMVAWDQPDLGDWGGNELCIHADSYNAWAYLNSFPRGTSQNWGAGAIKSWAAGSSYFGGQHGAYYGANSCSTTFSADQGQQNADSCVGSAYAIYFFAPPP